jgi:hypothetical protein
MIFAEINGKFALDNLEDAEALLRIIGRARQLDDNYDLPGWPNRYYEARNKTSIEIAVHSFEPYGYEEAQELIKKEREEKAKKAELKAA